MKIAHIRHVREHEADILRDGLLANGAQQMRFAGAAAADDDQSQRRTGIVLEPQIVDMLGQGSARVFMDHCDIERQIFPDIVQPHGIVEIGLA
ncbi:MAG: hypothetical protein BWZ10_01133 [candidate division BRC1 bacterium ADurb.BinA364]|nr:MAG: hypothetical protein BWZ10_01133 [candidate division BRC1 bacterium ADurb.BinA364]